MATTDFNIPLIGKEPTDVLIGTSTAMIVQNTLNTPLAFRNKDGSVEGGVINPTCAPDFDVDIEVWNPSGKEGVTLNVYGRRD